mmetsp:Transcript_56579/g.131876  ORF Transcript_56579/g.131876 Transcript_56579/m.131876 type:complete len:280 (+) Transcript_56579:455-1294(+)
MGWSIIQAQLQAERRRCQLISFLWIGNSLREGGFGACTPLPMLSALLSLDIHLQRHDQCSRHDPVRRVIAARITHAFEHLAAQWRRAQPIQDHCGASTDKTPDDSVVSCSITGPNGTNTSSRHNPVSPFSRNVQLHLHSFRDARPVSCKDLQRHTLATRQPLETKNVSWRTAAEYGPRRDYHLNRGPNFLHWAAAPAHRDFEFDRGSTKFAFIVLQMPPHHPNMRDCLRRLHAQEALEVLCSHDFRALQRPLKIDLQGCSTLLGKGVEAHQQADAWETT